ncbi:MAG: Zn-dependent exopeptidase M28 [Firmicutes bacterium]|nr:Zn-dependent exopeptidase M28 [Bacillota bacterium]
MSIKVTDEDGRYMHDFVSKVGSFTRSPGSQGERKGAEMAADAMKKFAHEVKIEDFQLAPKAALGWIKFVIPLFLVAVALFKIEPIISALIMIFNFFILIGQFVFYKKIIDPFYPQKTSCNTYGVINPTGEKKQTIIFAGHIDSAFQFNLIKWWGGRAYTVLVFLVLVTFLVFGITSIANGILVAMSNYGTILGVPEIVNNIFHIIWIVIICLTPLAILFFFFTTWIETPGCADNLSGVSVALGVGRALNNLKEKGGFFPKHTRVVTMAFGAEEAFLRGAMAYVKAHRDRLIAENTILINLETLVEKDDLFVMTSDLNGTVKLSKKVVDDLKKTAHKLGYKMGTMGMPLGGGSSDSAAFARAGIETSCIIGLDLGKVIEGKGYLNHYHTVRDTPDKVDPKVLQQALHICLNYLKMKDEEVS